MSEKDLKALLKLTEELNEMKELRRVKLEQAAESRQCIDSHLRHVLSSLSQIESNVSYALKLNDSKLVELNGLVANSKSLAAPPMADIQPHDTLASIKAKMAAISLGNGELLDATAFMAEKLESRKKAKISIRLLDEHNDVVQTVPMLENGFSAAGSEESAEMVLISHAVFVLLDRNSQKN